MPEVDVVVCQTIVRFVSKSSPETLSVVVSLGFRCSKRELRNVHCDVTITCTVQVMYRTVNRNEDVFPVKRRYSRLKHSGQFFAGRTASRCDRTIL